MSYKLVRRELFSDQPNRVYFEFDVEIPNEVLIHLLRGLVELAIRGNIATRYIARKGVIDVRCNSKEVRDRVLRMAYLAIGTDIKVEVHDAYDTSLPPKQYTVTRTSTGNLVIEELPERTQAPVS